MSPTATTAPMDRESAERLAELGAPANPRPVAG
jgi:hypothetical protein